ncbi:hypothetical protein BC833DRAFT_611669 [Globomyces pollinis-pini]|nr:hypothetical protein BC833DRAFT_611669 [Globomyces pollinis-pini]
MQNNDQNQTKVIIIGAGFSGIGLACQLKRKLKYHNFRIYDRAPELGGTWFHNTYPGAQCDIPSVMYSYYFFPNYHWTQIFSAQPEILQYMNRVSFAYGLKKHLQFNTECLGAKWCSETAQWNVEFQNLKTLETYTKSCKVLITGAGILTVPNDFPLPGKENFKGEIFHSAKWNHQVDLTNKQVVVIGNGCSATQFVPVIVDKTKKTVQFIRSAHSLLPTIENDDVGLSKFIKTCMNYSKYIPFLNTMLRYLLFFTLDADFELFDFEHGSKRRQEGDLKSKLHIEKNAPAKYIKMLTFNQEFGSKRRVFDTGYLECLHKSNMELRNDRLARVVENGVITESNELIPADVIISANGFKAQELLMPMTITGDDGMTLTERWAKQNVPAQAYKGTFVSNCPNFAMLMGPNTVTGHHSVIFTSECQMNLIIDYLKPLLIKPWFKPTVRTLKVKDTAEIMYNNWIRNRFEKLIWKSPKAKDWSNWYVHHQSGQNALIYPHYQSHFYWDTLWMKKSDFEYVY